MKYYNKFLLGAISIVAFASCADNNSLDFTPAVGKSDSLVKLSYLNNYDVLKKYVDRTANPNFKLGTGVDVGDFNSKGTVYAVTVGNFDEMTAGNAMKYGSCVSDNGNMDFGPVKKFISTAQNAGLSIFGHTLAWHSQQNNKYLNSIIADKVSQGGTVTYVDKQDGFVDYSKFTSFPYYVMGFTPTFSDGCMVSSNPSGAWIQYFVANNISTPSSAGGNFKITAMMQGSSAGSLNVNVGDWGKTVSGTLNFTTEMKEVSVSVSGVSVDNSFIVFQPGTFKGDIKIKWIKVTHQVAANITPLTAQEKKDTLTWAMGNWIQGMMSACKGSVKAWDVVNEPISGKDNDGDGFYDLQSATRGTVSAKDASANFYWQDYMGDLDYVRTAVADARKYFAASGGNASDLKLFINDYNLESDWDHNQKLISLINWIGKWEADGTTKIDGIGTQMHVSYNENSTKQKSQEDAIVNMFKIMAATKKLVRISELDMGILDANGNKVLTPNITDAQLKEQAAFYQFIVKAYFDNVPAAQRYGIAQWAQTDSPSTTGAWRANEPIGLWNSSYNRKRAYAGFADGLAGKVVYPAE